MSSESAQRATMRHLSWRGSVAVSPRSTAWRAHLPLSAHTHNNRHGMVIWWWHGHQHGYGGQAALPSSIWAFSCSKSTTGCWSAGSAQELLATTVMMQMIRIGRAKKTVTHRTRSRPAGAASLRRRASANPHPTTAHAVARPATVKHAVNTEVS